MDSTATSPFRQTRAPASARRMVPVAAALLTAALAAPLAAGPIPATGYLFAHFYANGESGLHLAWSADGIDWNLLNNGNSYLVPAVGESKLMRDPSLIRGPDGVFHMVWTTSWSGQTIGYASSPDLLTWSEQRALPVMGHEPRAGNCWAPEIIWDPTRGTYLILWSTTIPGAFPETALSNRRPSRNHRIYSTTTRDFQAFTPTRLHYDGGFNVIDAVLAQTDEDWIMFVKDETLSPVTQKNIRMLRAPTPYGPFSAPSAPLSTGAWSEGPSIIRVGEAWHLYYDQHMIDVYGLVRSRDLVEWESMDGRTQFPKDANHGSFVKVPGEVIARLVAATPVRHDVLDHGAVPDGETSSTSAIRSAIAACADAGGGTVHFPPGRYLTGPIELTANTPLVLADGAELILAGQPSPMPGAQPEYLLRARAAGNISIRGGRLDAERAGGGVARFEDCTAVSIRDTHAAGRTGIIVARADGFEASGVTVAADELPQFLIMDSREIKLHDVSSPTTSSEPVVALHNVRNAVIAHCIVEHGNRTFLQVLGSASDNIVLRQNDLSRATIGLVTGPDVFPGRVTEE